MKHIIGPAIRLQSGAYFDFEDPEASEFTIHDIAHGLSNLCRFTGQCHTFYSVAEHSYHASRIVPEGFAFQALMHDAAEAFIGDVAKPLKTLLPDYAVIEKRVEKAVLARFGLSPEMSVHVKDADLAMLHLEKIDALGCATDIWPEIEGRHPAPVQLHFWTPKEARIMFLERFRVLSGGYQ